MSAAAALLRLIRLAPMRATGFDAPAVAAEPGFSLAPFLAEVPG